MGNENGDWGLGIRDWGLGSIPIPNPHSPLFLIIHSKNKIKLIYLIIKNKNKNNLFFVNYY